jgi:hypothetical protein
MLSKVSLGIAIAASLAGGGGALAANGQAVFSSSGAEPHVAATVDSSQSVSTGQPVTVGGDVTPPTVPRGTLTIVVTAPAASASASSSNAASSSSLAVGATDSTEAHAAFNIVNNLQSVCPTLSSLLSSATKQLAVVPTANSAIFQVTASERTNGAANTDTTLLVDTSANTVTSTDPVTAAALSTCARVADLSSSAGGSGSVSFSASSG